MKRVFILSILSLLCIAVLQAQPLRESSYPTMVATAEEQYELKDYYRALEWYEKAYDESSDKALIPYIAEMHYKLRDYNRAENWYSRLLRRDKNNEWGEIRFEYARCLKMNGKYDEAIIEFQQFIAETEDPVKRELAKAELTGAEMALSAKDEELDVTVVNAGNNINTRTSEYAATLNRNGELMYFVGFATDDIIEVDEGAEDYHAKIMVSRRGERGWEDPTPLDESVNRPDVNSSGVTLSKDGNTMYFTRAVLMGNVVTESRIYYSVGGDNNWSGAEEVSGINGDYLVQHPAVGELFGSEVLFFVSDMDGGEGQSDIYYATRRGEGVFGEPVNLGATINTVGNEITPFYHNGTLYFSTDGLPGYGGYDIFYTTWDGVQWSEPKNLGPGYNTMLDDKYFMLDEDGYSGLLLSNREGGRSVKSKTCCDDIYYFDIDKIEANLVVGIFDENREPLLGGTVQLIETRSSEINSQTQEEGNRFDYGLGLELPYKIVATREGYFPDSTTISTIGLTESKTYEHRFYLRKKPVEKPPVVPEEPEFDTITIEEAIVLENILYDFDKADIKPEAEQDLQLIYDLLQDYPEMKIEMRSHTDYRGIDDYNERLSQRRAESARNWLIEKGVDPDRIVARGYGESVPQTITERMSDAEDIFEVGDILTPSFIDSLAEEETQELAHSINRRTEFKIIEGPTSIVLKRAALQKADDPNTVINKQGERIKISPLSALYGKEIYEGVPILVVDDRTINFGTVKKGEKREHTFAIANKGDVNAKIDLISACDCTTIEKDWDVIKPGETVELKIIFDSSEKDEAEIIDIDIFLGNELPGSDEPFIEKLRYRFDIEK